MKLELKHLAPYLPYGLKTDKGILSGIELSNNESDIYWIDNDKGIGHHYDYADFKPILRPLSDLTKEIEHNNSVLDLILYLCNTYDYRGQMHIIQDIVKEKIPIAMYFELLRWHFDVFGLIDKGLAVPFSAVEKTKA